MGYVSIFKPPARCKRPILNHLLKVSIVIAGRFKFGLGWTIYHDSKMLVVVPSVLFPKLNFLPNDNTQNTEFPAGIAPSPAFSGFAGRLLDQ